jgi:membrane protein DedA with SNARE-associated domain
VGTLIAFVVASNLGNVFLSVLVTERPLVFIGLNAQNRNLALASGELSAWSFYLVGFLRLVAPDPLFFLLGRWYGDAAIRWMERKAPAYGELLRMLERGFDKARFVVVAIAPNNPVSLFAGAAGMSFAAFMVANVVGTIGRLVLIRAFSGLFEGELGSLRSFISDYRWPIVAVSVVLVGLSMWSDRRGGRDGISDLAHLDDDIAEIEAELEAEEAELETGARDTDAGT